MKHGLDVGGFLLDQLRAFLNFFNHGVECHEGETNFIHALDWHAMREVLAGGDFGHQLLHPADGPGDLAVQDYSDRREHKNGDERDCGNGLGRVHQAQIQG